MEGIFDILRKKEKAFTGLESIIVLTSFVVVASVFSYVVLGAGFTTSDITRTTIDEDINQTISSVELAGSVIAEGTANTSVDSIIVTLQLTEDQTPVDIGEDSTEGITIISYSDSNSYSPETTWTRKFIGNNDGDDTLEQYERVEITVTVPDNAMLKSDNLTDVVNREFKLEVKPKIGPVLPVSRVTPLEINAVMNLG